MWACQIQNIKIKLSEPLNLNCVMLSFKCFISYDLAEECLPLSKFCFFSFSSEKHIHALAGLCLCSKENDISFHFFLFSFFKRNLPSRVDIVVVLKAVCRTILVSNLQNFKTTMQTSFQSAFQQMWFKIKHFPQPGASSCS